MKLLALISMGVAASYWYKTIKDSKPTLLKPNFDEIVKNFVLAEFKALMCAEKTGGFNLVN